MSLIDSHISLGRPIIDTSAAGDDELGSVAFADNAKRWTSISDELVSWWNSPELAVVDEGEVGPTRELIHEAVRFALVGREQNAVPPTRFAPSIDGGIAFEWEHEAHLVRVVFLNSMRIEVDQFVGTEVVWSQRVAIVQQR